MIKKSMAAEVEKPRVVADVDTGIDDSLALIYLAYLHSAGEIDLVVTTSAGNTTVGQAAVNSKEVLRLAGAPEVSVVAGAGKPLVLPLTTTPETHGKRGLGYYSPELEAGCGDAHEDVRGDVRAAVEAWREATHILVAGPATNLAWALAHEPEVVGQAQITLMTGAFNYPGNTTPTAEWNAWVDPHALKAVFGGEASGESVAQSVQSPQRLLPVICPLNVTEQVLLHPLRLSRWQDAVRPSHPQLAALLGDTLRFYFEFHQSVGVGYCAQIHDLAAAMVMLGRVPCSLYDATVDVEADSPLMRGTTVADRVVDGGGGSVAAVRGDVDPAGARGAYWNRPANARILEALDPADVFAEFERVVCGFGAD